MGEWKQLVKDFPGAGNTVQFDASSPFEELRHHNTILHMVVLGFYSLGILTADVVTLLLSNGANPNLQNDKGETPLHIVCQSTLRDPELARILISYRADPNIRTLDGNMPKD